ncbi:MAG: hypothetical protein AAGU14_09455, partial [Eubacteriaceae bacterium]
STFSRNTLFNVCRGKVRFKKSENLNNGLNLLCEYGYLQSIYFCHTGSGRPSSPRYAVNPNIYE